MFLRQSVLYRGTYSDENLWKAWRAVKGKNGAAGSDGVSLALFERNLLANLKALQGLLVRRNYRPATPKTFHIAKKDGGKRPIAMLCVADRVVERALHQAISPVVDPRLHPSSHAFRPARSTKTAIEHLVRLAGHHDHWLGHVDIASCFPSLAHWHLRRQLRRFVKARDVRGLIHTFIALGADPSAPHKAGVLQGGALSPLLSNLYLDALDRRLEARGIRFVRYADNILFVGPSKQAVQAATRETTKALRKIDLCVNDEKTVITHLGRGLAVLGYLLREAKDDPRRVLYRDLHPPKLEPKEGHDEPGEADARAPARRL